MLIQPNIPSVTLTKSAGQSLLGVISKARGMLTHTTNIDSCSSGHSTCLLCHDSVLVMRLIHLPFYVHFRDPELILDHGLVPDPGRHSLHHELD